MMPKVTLHAPAGVGGTIHASQSGENYEIDADGHVTVNHVDVPALLAGGYMHVPHDGTPNTPMAAPVGSVSVGSTIAGATAIDPAKRVAGKPEATVTTDGQDFGDATPPHGLPAKETDPTLVEAGNAEAIAERDQAERSGVDASHVSAHADTGNMSTVKQSSDAQETVRSDPKPSDAHDVAFAEFKDHAGQESDKAGDDPKLRGKSKDEIDAVGKAS